MNQGEVLSRTWKLLWKHKVLYLLGLVSSLVFSGPTFICIIFLLTSLNKFESLYHSMNNRIQSMPIYGWVLIGLVWLAVWAVVLYLTQSFKAAQYRGAWQVDTAEPQELSFGQLWREGQPYVLRMVLLNLIFGGISLIGVLAVIIPFAYGMISEAYWLLCLALLVVFVLPAVTILIQIFIQLGGAAIVVENLGAIAAIRRAWDVAIHHKAAIALLMLFLYLINYGISMLIQTPFSFLIGLVPGFMGTTSIVVILGMAALMWLVVVLYTGLWMSFNDTAWVVAYNRLTRPAEPALTDVKSPQTQG
ncbi:MAG TPA: hypothetical protein PKH92_00920 [Anaerolineaceae bacterium]|jgi:hypothetical protein|nr:hypothetical protein [Anaerolineaceae bacterium]HQN43592.1 hypothetical protein [Anaerolineaceae bacterium]